MMMMMISTLLLFAFVATTQSVSLRPLFDLKVEDLSFKFRVAVKITAT